MGQLRLARLLLCIQHRIPVSADDEPWFAAADVCGILGIARAGSSPHLPDSDEKGYAHYAHLRGGAADHCHQQNKAPRPPIVQR
jgi:prophage antirepressor-like protein